jgi:hypothetical protein
MGEQVSLLFVLVAAVRTVEGETLQRKENFLN